MLIAIIGNSAESLLNFRSSLIRSLIARGHKVAALAPDFDQETLHATEQLGATPVGFPLSRGGTNPSADAMSLLALRRALSGMRPDAVLSYFIKPAIYGNLAAAIVGALALAHVLASSCSCSALNPVDRATAWAQDVAAGRVVAGPAVRNAAARHLRRAPGFASLAIAMLALGIGANVAIFSIFQSIILRPLPYPEQEQLVGFKSMSSEQLASGNLIFGSWDEVVIGDWGVLELAMDTILHQLL